MSDDTTQETDQTAASAGQPEGGSGESVAVDLDLSSDEPDPVDPSTAKPYEPDGDEPEIQSPGIAAAVEEAKSRQDGAADADADADGDGADGTTRVKLSEDGPQEPEEFFSDARGVPEDIEAEYQTTDSDSAGDADSSDAATETETETTMSTHDSESESSESTSDETNYDAAEATARAEEQALGDDDEAEESPEDLDQAYEEHRERMEGGMPDPEDIDLEDQDWSLGETKGEGYRQFKDMWWKMKEPEEAEAVNMMETLQTVQDSAARFRVIFDHVIVEPTITDERFEAMTFMEKAGLASRCLEYAGFDDLMDFQ